MSKLERKLLIAVAKLLAELVTWKSIDSGKAHIIFKLVKELEDETSS